MDSLGLDTSSKLRLQLLLGMCIITGGIFLCLSILNLGLTSSYLLGSLQLIFASFSIYLAYTLRQKKIKPRMQFCYLMSLSLLVLFAAYSTSLIKAAYLWALILPMIYYFLLGRKQAWLLCVGILFGQVSIIYSKTGIFLSPPVVNFAMCYVLIWYISHIYDTARNRSEAALAKLALKDALTGVNNRLALKRSFELESKPMVDSQDPSLSLILIDVDFFKKVNDMHGHETGDSVLIEIGKLLSSKVGSDKVFRIGGEEFCILLSGKNLDQASLTAEKLRQGVQDQKFISKGDAIAVTISLGVAECEAEMSLTQALNQADEALYRAKAQGRNCVVSAVSEQELPS